MTIGAHALMVPIHGRMPVIIRSDHWQEWQAAPMEEIERLVASFGVNLGVNEKALVFSTY